MNNNPTYQQPLCTSCATSIGSNTATTRQRDVNETITTANDTVRLVPQLRFPEFQDTGKWEGVSLGGEMGLCELRNGYTPSKDNTNYWRDGVIPWFRMEDIRENGRILNDAIQHITIEAVKGKLFEANSVIMSTSATIGEFALITTTYLANQRFTNLCIRKSSRKNVDVFFFFYYCYQISKWCKRNTNLGGLLSVNVENLKKYKLYIPTNKYEQQKIADCLHSLDDYIAATTQKLEQLKLH